MTLKKNEGAGHCNLQLFPDIEDKNPVNINPALNPGLVLLIESVPEKKLHRFAISVAANVLQLMTYDSKRNLVDSLDQAITYCLRACGIEHYNNRLLVEYILAVIYRKDSGHALNPFVRAKLQSILSDLEQCGIS